MHETGIKMLILISIFFAWYKISEKILIYLLIVLICYFSNCFSFHSVFTGFFNEHDYSFDNVKEIGWSFVKSYPLDRKVFQNKCYDVIISITTQSMFYHENQIILYMLSCAQTLITLTLKL